MFTRGPGGGSASIARPLARPPHADAEVSRSTARMSSSTGRLSVRCDLLDLLVLDAVRSKSSSVTSCELFLRSKLAELDEVV
jgi:hypothetical protein